MKITKEQFEKLTVCDKVADYIKEQGSLAKAWDNTDRGDWMWQFFIHFPILKKEQSVKLANLMANRARQLPSDCIDAVDDVWAIHTAARIARYARIIIARTAEWNCARFAYIADTPIDAIEKDGPAYTAAYLVERKQQAEDIRSIVDNPFA